VKRRARFCLQCGAALRDARDGDRVRRRCPRCGFTFYDNPALASCAVVRRRGRVLLARRANPPYAGLWDLPGGFLEAGETPERALRRELREELGVTPRRARLVGFEPDRYGPDGFPTLTAVYRVDLEPGPMRCADDVTEVRWFPIGDIPFRSVAFSSMRRALRKGVGITSRSPRARGRSSRP
jgi:ADP-ribose pyrophosphatase YjhB (NUDIX family)